MRIAVGSKSFFTSKLSGIPKKVLFLGLEEYWERRIERNKEQMSSFTVEEQEVLSENYLYQPIDFSKHIVKASDWKLLGQTIRESKADVVFIDSITRMNHGNLEDSKTAEEIMQKLRELCYGLKITLICIHHTPKIGDEPITMNKIKGSSTFSQEADFAIAVNRTSKNIRYLKEVFYRYASDDISTVDEFIIDDNVCPSSFNKCNEFEILKRGDRRYSDENENEIIAYLENNACREYATSLLIKELTAKLQIKERRLKHILSDLVKDSKISNPRRGINKSIKCIGEEAQDEE